MANYGPASLYMDVGGRTGGEDSADVTKMKRAGMTSEYLSSLDSQYRKIYGRGMPGDTYDMLKGDRGLADQFQAYLNQAKSNGAQSLAANESDRDRLVSLGLLTTTDIARYDKDVADKEAEGKVAPDIYSDPNVQKVQKELQAVVDKGVPEFAYGGKSEQDYITQWQNQLSAINKPQQEYALGQLNKSVADTYNFYNPYTLGSGTQIKATQDATNQFLMSAIAQQDAQAMALGESSYNRDYGTAYNQWANKQAQYNAAQAKLLDLATAETAGKSTDYYNTLNRQWTLQDTQAAQAYEDKQAAQQYQYAQDIAKMYQPQTQEWYQQLLQPALTGVGYALGGGLGGAAASGIGSLFSSTPSSGQTGYYQPSYNIGGYSYSNPSRINLNYNPYMRG